MVKQVSHLMTRSYVTNPVLTHSYLTLVQTSPTRQRHSTWTQGKMSLKAFVTRVVTRWKAKVFTVVVSKWAVPGFSKLDDGRFSLGVLSTSVYHCFLWRVLFWWWTMPALLQDKTENNVNDIATLTHVINTPPSQLYNTSAWLYLNCHLMTSRIWIWICSYMGLCKTQPDRFKTWHKSDLIKGYRTESNMAELQGVNPISKCWLPM